MRIRRFTARDMTEALRLVREELGPEAVILEAKGVAEGRGPRSGVTVMAAVDRHPEVRGEAAPAGRPASQAPDERSGLTSEPARIPARPPAASAPEAHEEGGRDQEIKRLQSRIFYLNRLVTSDHFSTIPIPLRELYLDLLEAEVDSNLAFAILRDVAGHTTTDIVSGPQIEPLRERLLKVVPQGTPIPDRPGRRVVLLVGPPGAGKTGVAAALAAQAVRAGRRPGLLSIDSFRPGGISGLSHYARILDVPCVSLIEPEDLGCIQDDRLAEADLILVDTPGVSLREREAVSLVRRFQLGLHEPETHAVLDATGKVRDSAETLALLRHYRLTSLIFTKLDLTHSYGGVLSLSLKTRVPISHWRWGQRILEDLRVCQPRELVQLVLDRCASGWERPAETGPGRAAKEAVR